MSDKPSDVALATATAPPMLQFGSPMKMLAQWDRDSDKTTFDWELIDQIATNPSDPCYGYARIFLAAKAAQ